MKKVSKEGKLAFFSIVMFVLSILPILYLTQYVHATGDDYGYSALTHAAWLESRSLIELMKASFATIQKYYIGWQGTWFSVFLFTLQPEVFSPDAYWIVPILMMFFIIIGTSFVGYYFLVCKAGMKKSSFVVIDCMALFSMIQFFPSTKSGIFWYNGAAHYVIPYFLSMLSIYYFIRFIDSYKKRYMAGAAVCMALLGGASYLAALSAPIILVLMLICYGKKRPGSFWLLIPLGMELTGLVISFLAPGNKVRGGEYFGFSVYRVLSTIGGSFKNGVETIGIYVKEKPFIFVILLFAAAFIWSSFEHTNKRVAFKRPLLFCLYMFCTYCAMFAPGIYAGTELSGGVPNMIFQVFVLTTLAEIIYLEGWLYAKKADSGKEMGDGKKARLLGGCFMIFACLLIVFFTRSTLKDTTFFKCVTYIASGQASDYGDQMEERLAILLDDSKKDVQLPAINQDQGPLMHMEVTKDKEGWTNRVVRDFYRKDSVVEIDRLH